MNFIAKWKVFSLLPLNSICKTKPRSLFRFVFKSFFACALKGRFSGNRTDRNSSYSFYIFPFKKHPTYVPPRGLHHLDCNLDQSCLFSGGKHYLLKKILCGYLETNKSKLFYSYEKGIRLLEISASNCISACFRAYNSCARNSNAQETAGHMSLDTVYRVHSIICVETRRYTKSILQVPSIGLCLRSQA